MYGAIIFKICLMIVILYLSHLLRCYHNLTHLIPFGSICIVTVNSAGHECLLKIEPDVKLHFILSLSYLIFNPIF